MWSRYCLPELHGQLGRSDFAECVAPVRNKLCNRSKRRPAPQAARPHSHESRRPVAEGCPETRGLQKFVPPCWCEVRTRDAADTVFDHSGSTCRGDGETRTIQPAHARSRQHARFTVIWLPAKVVGRCSLSTCLPKNQSPFSEDAPASSHATEATKTCDR